MTTIGALFAGYGGLELAVEAVTGGRTIWHSEIDPAPAAIHAAHWPDSPNLGDITAIDWTQVEPVDVICGGFPCQDISTAGRGAGIKEGTRSGLWYRYADAVRVLRPRYVVVENVGALVVRGLDIVVGDLAALGYDCRWACVRASDAGAPHRRERLFIVAALATDLGHEWPRGPRQGRPGLTDSGGALADTPGVGRCWRPSVERNGRREDQWCEEGDRVGNSHTAWGPYAAAINRWESILGRPAPAPTDDRGRLNPVLVEWMMGLPAGRVTGRGLSRTAELKMLGNGVVPQQAEVALRHLGLGA